CTRDTSMAVITNIFQNLASHLHVVEWYSTFSIGLCFFVTLPRDEYYVTGLSFADSDCDCGFAVGLHLVFCPGTLQTDHCIIHDCNRVFTSRIVRSKNYKVTTTSSGFAHQRPLGPIAVASTAKDRNDPATLSGLFHE